jgi:alpha-N-arabinofuranosidase
MSEPVENPVIPGFHPDPSICRVGEDYYLANSSFEWFPGVPIHHSRDLVHWRLIGNALTRDSQLPLQGVGHSGGIWAPTLRWHDGTFHLVTTDVGAGGNLLVSARDPAGPWSEPIWFDRDGYDPSLFIEDDGTAWLTKAGSVAGGGHGIVQYRIDLRTGARRDEPRLIWGGSGGFGVEGPHLYRIGGWWYLLAAEGATHVGHMATIARARDPWGPFEGCPRNPVLSHRDHLGRTIQATGHADLVQAQDGSWWLACLGIRSHGSLCMAQHLLGRETMLAPVSWDADLWPVVGGGAGVPERVASALPDHHWPSPSSRDDFDARSLAPCWCFLRNPDPRSWTLAERPGFLRLRATTPTLETSGTPALLARRQCHRDCRVRLRLEARLEHDGDEAGLTVFANGAHHHDLGIVRRGAQRFVQLRRRADDLEVVVASAPIGQGAVTFEAWCNPWAIGFSYAELEAPLARLAKASTKMLTTEFAGGFTGCMLGAYALGGAIADVDWFEYGPSERMP